MDRQGALSVSRGQDTILRFQYCQLTLQLTNKCPQLPPMYYATCCARYVLEERNKRNVNHKRKQLTYGRRKPVLVPNASSSPGVSLHPGWAVAILTVGYSFTHLSAKSTWPRFA